MIAVVLGAIVLGERLPARTLAGGALILLGVVLAARGTRTEAAAGA
jgi:drug/metabolite transporter (DMT)-like permease